MQMGNFPMHHSQIENVRWNVHDFIPRVSAGTACCARTTEKPGNRGIDPVVDSMRFLSRISGYWFILHHVYDPFGPGLGGF